jgi:hypothetical protein
MEEVSLSIGSVGPNELEAAVGEFAGEGARFETLYGNFDPVTGSLVIVGLLAGGKLVIRLWREFNGGTVIDLTGSPTKISRSRALDYGYLVIIAKDGKVTIEAKDEPEDALERIVKAALQLGVTATIDDLHTVVRGELEAKAPVHLNPA